MGGLEGTKTYTSECNHAKSWILMEFEKGPG